MTRAGAPALMACMRNEGLHLIEWLAYHRVIGFGEAVIASNDCDDASDTLLDRLASAGEVTHLRNAVPPGTPPQRSGAALCLARLAGGAAEWVAHVDADEFVHVRLGAGRIEDLVAVAPAAHVIALGWRNFGDGGHTAWPGATLPHFTRREGPPRPREAYFKCVFRHRAFAAARAHMPAAPRIPDPVVVNAGGETLDNANLFSDTPRVRFFPVARALRLDLACINHYPVKSPDLFALRRARGRGENTTGHDKYRAGSEWHRRANRNEVEDRAILRHWPATRAEMARLRALPGVAAAEAACIAWAEAARAPTTEAHRA